MPKRKGVTQSLCNQAMNYNLCLYWSHLKAPKIRSASGTFSKKELPSKSKMCRVPTSSYLSRNTFSCKCQDECTYHMVNTFEVDSQNVPLSNLRFSFFSFQYYRGYYSDPQNQFTSSVPYSCMWARKPPYHIDSHDHHFLTKTSSCILSSHRRARASLFTWTGSYVPLHIGGLLCPFFT